MTTYFLCFMHENDKQQFVFFKFYHINRVNFEKVLIGHVKNDHFGGVQKVVKNSVFRCFEKKPDIWSFGHLGQMIGQIGVWI